MPKKISPRTPLAALPTPEQQAIESLHARLRSVRGLTTTPYGVRLHRAISWLTCAASQTANLDLRFISLWVAFNACYASGTDIEKTLAERTAFRDFIRKLVQHDAPKQIYELLWNKFSGPVRALMENHFVFQPFWEAQRAVAQGQPEGDWRRRFEKHKSCANRYFVKGHVELLLAEVLDRLYVLRNQLMHGGATFSSKVNRTQVKDGCNMLAVLMPVVVDIMLSAQEENWGEIQYPVINPS